MKLIVLLLILLISLGVWETARHRWFLRRIPVRVHVNGSRGKSSVARLIAARYPLVDGVEAFTRAAAGGVLKVMIEIAQP